jgi:hypothetical protein
MPVELPPLPEALARRPVDRRGYPIPWSVVIGADGVPDFRSMHPTRWLAAVERRLCALCGGYLGVPSRGAWFVGGPLCQGNRLFTDPAMHEACARFALQVCPFLAAPRMHYSTRPPPPGFGIAASVSPDRPDRFMLGHAWGRWAIVRNGADMLIRASPWLSVEWWREGKPLAG